MRSTLDSLNALMALAAMSMSGAAEPIHQIRRSHSLRQAFGARGTWVGRFGNPSGATYPEQSSRQGMRGARRAQGGPGIELVGGVYRAKEWV